MKIYFKELFDVLINIKFDLKMVFDLDSFNIYWREYKQYETELK